ncbi:hypothetical protein G6F57_009919 [Rhizopus arrhizus]|uniref:Uncharacterized protein n=1 Tax=Rhizopus oryzae TaxID=64495 RepID=A0A9P7BR78_RHIOR|nr:hypothetical protein G6F23_012107 [Rhizopus arrhizus]KAG1414015.1 hypothetical protein G6F58_007171 [Rhizopus delemar]KAG0766188.1 hypothetical protein G6F24_003804 [Rhizopus arrhizus]KAG0792984.1 hypothetical protein G6F21_003957 [Rhizopus arrhizus]KAG0799016.1 hypothetical protein G6F22_003650 [Rhizopus arrhizus]
MTPVYRTSFQNSFYYDTTRLGQIEAQHELARNFYDDDEFCPIYSTDHLDDRDRIQQRLTPSPRTSPSIKNSKRVIPIINPNNMTPISILHSK